MQTQTIEIGDRKVGPGFPCFVIAEAGVNHNGEIQMAMEMIRAAARSGADAIKFQTFKAEKLVSIRAAKAKYQIANSHDSESQLEMLRRLELDEDSFNSLRRECLNSNILFLSTPFDEESLDQLVDLEIPAIKIASGEINNFPLLEHIARTGKPMILSTGMSYLGEVDAAVRTIRSSGNHQLALLHCTSNYPAHPADMNLRAMHTLAEAFQLPVGLSDHSEGIEIPLAAVAMGACVLEKHFTLDRSLPGPDQSSSIEPDELTSMIQGIRKVEAALGHGRKEPVERELETVAVARKSLVACEQIRAGSQIENHQIAIMRPGTGLAPAMLPYVVGRVAKMDIPVGEMITFEMLE
jgi:N-acetylneuraminate synthase